MGTADPSGRVSEDGAAVRLICCCAVATPAPNRRTAAPRTAAFVIALRVLIRIPVLLAYLDSSMTNSRESMSIIIIIPPGNALLVVISRSLWECHINAKPASPPGEFAIVPDGGVVPVGPVARVVASGPRYGLPPYHAPLVRMFASVSVAGPPAATSPNGCTCSGLL